MRLLSDVEFRPGADRLIMLGDYVGAHGENIRCLREIERLRASGAAVALLGNHDQALCECVARGGRTAGELPEIYAYVPRLAAEIRSKHPALAAMLCGLPLWYEDETFIAVHAGFNPTLPDWRRSTPEEFTTIRAQFLEHQPSDLRTVVFGHTPCQRLHGTPDIWFGEGKVGIDGGAAHGQQLNCLLFDGRRLLAHAVPVTGGASTRRHDDV